jgi:quercetin dioxygenase-like cupin family protein
MSADDPVNEEQVLAQLAGATRPAELAAGKRDDLRRRVLERARETAPEGTMTLRAADAEWVALDADVQVRVLRRDAATRTQTLLMRVAAGGRIAAHRHQQEEEFIVLEGECRVGGHRLTMGDVHVAQAGSWHDDITTRSGVLVMVRGDYTPPAGAG